MDKASQIQDAAAHNELIGYVRSAPISAPVSDERRAQVLANVLNQARNSMSGREFAKAIKQRRAAQS